MANDEQHHEERGFDVSDEEVRRGENKLFHDLIHQDHTFEECGYDGETPLSAVISMVVPAAYAKQLEKSGNSAYLYAQIKEILIRMFPEVDLANPIDISGFEASPVVSQPEMVIPELEPELPEPIGNLVNKIADSLKAKSQVSKRHPVTTHGQPFDPYVVMERMLNESLALLAGPRAHEYGNPIEMHGKIAQAWSNVFGKTITEEEVALAMLEMKIERSKLKNWNLDSLHDLISYATIYGAIKQYRKFQLGE